jgi:hypothetical protein
MLVQLSERVLTYTNDQFNAWRNGDKSLIPDFVEDRSMIFNQPKYHFGEIFVLRYYYEAEGWLGFISYALGMQFPHSRNRAKGRAKVKEIIPAAKLDRLRRMRSHGQEARHGTGEPDLFLYRNTGEYKFVEVKKQTDRINLTQLKCMAQIVATLECAVEIVYLCEAGHRHTPKCYYLDLETFEGWKG